MDVAVFCFSCSFYFVKTIGLKNDMDVIFQAGERAPPKIATFCYYQFFLCQKKPIFLLFTNPL